MNNITYGLAQNEFIDYECTHLLAVSLALIFFVVLSAGICRADKIKI